MIHPGHDYPQAIAKALDDASLQKILATYLPQRCERTRQGVEALGDPEAFRDLAKQIKDYSIAHLDEMLEELAEQFEARGGVVHWARDAAEARQVITDIARQHGCRRCIKTKSMVTEEIELNPALEAAGVVALETDLGEFIVQLAEDRPSHIVTPMIHITRQKVGRLFQEKLGADYTESPEALTQIARRYLRDKFQQADLGITGANFAVAQTGTLCLITNEGNGRMVTALPRVHIALMGMEKVIPRTVDLAVMLKLFTRSAMGSPITVYTNLITGPRQPGQLDGPEHLHLVLLDNGRSRLLSGPYADTLDCLRCGACLNVCPVYRKIGGHAYGSVYTGPIGVAVTPVLMPEDPATQVMPDLCTLCGACLEACPVKIDIPRNLIGLRQESVAKKKVPWVYRLLMPTWAWFYRRPGRYRFSQRWGRRLLCLLARKGWVRWLPGLGAKWTASRDLPLPASKTFSDLWDESDGTLT